MHQSNQITSLTPVYEKAWGDSAFKEALLQDPKTILAQELGILLPEGVNLKAVEETDCNRYVLLRSEVAEAEGIDPLASVKAKAAIDEAFKQELIAAPKATIEREMGITIPSWIDVEVLEETPQQSYLIIPHLPDEEEVTEEEMMAVAGGRFRFRRFIRRVLPYLPAISVTIPF